MLEDTNNRRRFRRELQEWSPSSPGEDFYRAVWNRIHRKEVPVHRQPGFEFWDWLGGLCWKALPICLVLAFLAGGLALLSPSDSPAELSWEETILWNESEMSSDDLLILETLFFDTEVQVIL